MPHNRDFCNTGTGRACTIGNQTFSAFTFSGTSFLFPGGIPLEPSDLSYSTITNTINKEIGFSFSGPFFGTSPDGGAVVTLGYLITGPDIKYAGAALTGFSSFTYVDFFGIANITETICPGGTDVDHCQSPLSLFAQIEGFCQPFNGGLFPSPCSVGGLTAADAVTFSPVDELAVLKTVSLDAPPVNHGGFASLGGFNDISQVPEPSTMLLFVSGLLLLGIIVHLKKLHARDGLIAGLIDKGALLVRALEFGD